MIYLEKVIALENIKRGQRLAVANSFDLQDSIMKKDNTNLSFFNVNKVVKVNNETKVYASDNKSDVIFSNEFLRNNELYIVKTNSNEIEAKQEMNLTKETIILRKELKKKDKLLRKYKGYARKGKVMPGVPTKSNKPVVKRELISNISSNTRFGVFKIYTYCEGRKVICEVYDKSGKLLGTGYARCHEDDSYIIEKGVELAAARAMVKALENIL